MDKIDCRWFTNALKIMRSIDPDEFIAALRPVSHGVSCGYLAAIFRDDPLWAWLMMTDAQQAAIFDLIVSRQPKASTDGQ